MRLSPRDASRSLGVSWICAALTAALAAATPRDARAAPPEARDYFLTPPPKGLWLQTDVFAAGVQAALEKRIPILDDDVEMLTLRAHGLVSLGFTEAMVSADYRVLFLTLGGSVGTRHTFFTHANPHGTLTRDDRIALGRNSATFTSGANIAEGRARITVPLGPLFFMTNHALRWEDGPDGAFDWFHGNVHDAGTMYRADAALLLHTSKLGGLGPLVRYMNMPRLGFRKSEWSAGLMAATRPGLFRKQDVAFMQLLIRPGDREFGQHLIRIPLQVILAYRAQFELLSE